MQRENKSSKECNISLTDKEISLDNHIYMISLKKAKNLCHPVWKGHSNKKCNDMIRKIIVKNGGRTRRQNLGI